ncbi:hypothetical protein FRX31_034183 [Thalictrum thalictroides]|uniref:Uncharacterized protein n=1 Tax=Thalictrum thalictroides TaxID=46969 RepID=A0A7J6UUF9_THATH|nr:hypothetical protein FRX31_034183 [Thalictrum thalictroides]
MLILSRTMVIANLSDSSSQFSESYADIVKKNAAAKISEAKAKAKEPKVPIDSSADDKIVCNNGSCGVDYWNEYNWGVLRDDDELPENFVYKNADVSSDDNFSDYDSLIYLPKKSATCYI